MQQPSEPAGTSARGHVLVVDDDPTVAEVVAGYLDRAGYTVDLAGDGPSALARAHAHRPDLVVLDLMLPGMDGLEVCRRLRERAAVPVVMLTARGDEEDRVLGLEQGADDYVTKPFSPRELVLRVASVLRRTGPDAVSAPVRLGRLAVDPAARLATRDGEALSLTLREFDLLAFFLRHPGRAFGREELMREVWGWEFGDLSTVTVHIRRLRGKIEDDPAAPRAIRTVWGVGYRFEAEHEAGREADGEVDRETDRGTGREADPRVPREAAPGSGRGGGGRPCVTRSSSPSTPSRAPPGPGWPGSAYCGCCAAARSSPPSPWSPGSASSRCSPGPSPSPGRCSSRRTT
ncbi:response regulator transcription factor [Streptomyces sp. SPB074]|uniref:response regulator transcription factor n=1 Tax=Streptomyces sp. (strain SPB074) TaxID=465543 RepID=UPI0001D1E15D|nr:DNA-binding response regulator ResD [Streptomyces sp. SPB074]